MKNFQFPLAVLGTSLVLVGVLALASGYLVRGAFAAGPGGWSHAGGAWATAGGPWGDLPPELSDRFAHFRGVQVNLTDKDNKPLSLSVTPGTVSSVSPTSLTLSANDGTTRTFSLDDKTIKRGERSPAQGDTVVVASLNGSQTALAVLSGDQRGGPGPFGWH
jgi:hypothetical protein